ncbi:MAG: PKD domain-containing protein [Deltaproteobacteria bacterium]|nr:PKD domain-containing protein [Deltaproteobacteria bacterium]
MSTTTAPCRWALQLPVLACLALMGCRLIGCGEPSEDSGDESKRPVVAERLVAPTAGGAGVVVAPKAEPFEADDDGEDSPEELRFEAEAAPESGGAPLDVAFTLTIENPRPGLTVRWDFGDGSAPVGIRNPSHIYRDPGEYTAILTITAPGVEETREFNIEVAEEAFDIDIEVDPDIGKAPLLSHFTGVVPEEIENDVTYEWNFGDGAQATGKVTEHVYREPGTYNVKLTVTHTNGQHGTREVEIQVDEPDDSDDENSPDEDAEDLG